MKICMIVEDYPPKAGGGGMFVQQLSQRLAKQHEVTVLTPAYNLPEGVQREGRVAVSRLASSRFAFFFSVLWHVAAKERFDIYHAHGTLMGFIAKTAAVFKGAKSILHIHGFRDKELVGSLKYYGQVFLIKLGYDKIISVDEIGREKIIALGVPEEKMLSIPVGVDTKQFKPAAKKQQGKSKKPVFLFIGRLEKVKNLMTLLSAAKTIAAHGIEAEFLIIGDGEQRSSLEAFAKEGGIENVKFLGAIPHEKIKDAYNSADFFVLPSLSEGMPLTLLEAMACGLPFIVSDAPSLVRIAKESKVGFVFTRSDAEELAAGIMHCLGLKSAELAALKKNARSFAEKNYSWENVAKEIENIYTNL